ncbi:MAG: T9SS type A sorting domain-containing protein [bacterium]|nr:T9SS type A sorting domain-containing protein [bacterium]
MKRVLFLYFLLLIFTSADSAVYNLQHDDGSLTQAWFGSFYRGVRFYVSDSCTINTVYWGRYSKKNEIDTIFIYTDSANAPNKLLYSKSFAFNTGSAQAVMNDTVLDTIVVSQKFWLVMYSRTQDSPSNQLSYFISDGAGVGNSYWYDDVSGQWVQNSGGDYIMRLTVTGPLGMITLSEKDDTLNRTFDKQTDAMVLKSGNIAEKNKLNSFEISLKRNSNVSVSIIDHAGRTVSNIIERRILSEGKHTISWKTPNVSAGVYFLLVQTGDKLYSEKILVTK